MMVMGGRNTEEQKYLEISTISTENYILRYGCHMLSKYKATVQFFSGAWKLLISSLNCNTTEDLSRSKRPLKFFIKLIQG